VFTPPIVIAGIPLPCWLSTEQRDRTDRNIFETAILKAVGVVRCLRDPKLESSVVCSVAHESFSREDFFSESHDTSR
jgi:hypothetical protein